MPTIKDHPVIVVSGLIIAAFVAGISAFIWFEGEINKKINSNLKPPIVQSVPNGTIVAFYSKNGKVPEGWAICNGDNGTPDLTNKFIKGAGRLSDNGEKGGQDKIRFTVKYPEMELATVAERKPSVGNALQEALHAKSPNTGIVKQSTRYDDCVTPFTKKGKNEHFNLNIEPPYTKLVYIMKIPKKKV